MYGKVKTTVKGTGNFEIEIDKREAFRLLCDAMDMSFFYEDDSTFLVLKGEDEEDTYLYKKYYEDEGKCDDKDKISYKGRTYVLFDERGETYLALYNLADKVFMNIDSIIVANKSDLD